MKVVKDEKVLRAIAGQYDWRIRDVMKEAWKKVKGVKGRYWGAFGLFIAVSFGISFGFGIVEGIVRVMAAISYNGEITQEALMHLPVGPMIILSSLNIIFKIILYAITLPLLGGIIFIGIRHIVDKPVKATMVFKFFKFKYMLRFLVMFLIIFLLFLFLLFIPIFIHTIMAFQGISKISFAVLYVFIICAFIYFVVSFVLTVPLIVDRDCGAWFALITSLRAINHHWFKVFGLLFLCWLISIMSILLLGIGFIWVYPFLKNVLGIQYRETFGVVGLASE